VRLEQAESGRFFSRIPGLPVAQRIGGWNRGVPRPASTHRDFPSCPPGDASTHRSELCGTSDHRCELTKGRGDGSREEFRALPSEEESPRTSTA